MSEESTPQDPRPSEMALLRAEMRAGFQSVVERLSDHDKRFDKTDERFDKVDARFDKTDERFDKVDARFDKTDERFDKVDARLDKVDARFAQVDVRFDKVDARFAQVDARFAQVDARFDQVDARFAQVDGRFDKVDARFDKVDARFDKVGERLDGHDTVLVSLDTRITTEAAATRRHFDVVAEGLRESFKGVIDKTVATGKKVDRLIASNAVEHAAFLEALTDHEVRITRLETPPDSAPQA